MGRRGPKPRGDDGKTAPVYLFVPTTEEVWKLAREVIAAAETFFAVEKGAATKPHRIEGTASIRNERPFVILRIPEGSHDGALAGLAEYRLLKKQLFLKRDMLPSREQSPYLHHFVQSLRKNAPRGFTIVYTADSADTEIVVPLEEYLPHELIDMAYNLAENQQRECPLHPTSVALLTGFEKCFRSFIIIRTTFGESSRAITRQIIKAHDALLQLSEIIRRITHPENSSSANDADPELVNDSGSADSQVQSMQKEMSPQVRGVSTANSDSTVPASDALDELQPLHIKIERSPSEHFQFTASDGKINARQPSHKRTLIVIALFVANGRAITPTNFCKLFYGEVGRYSSARFLDSIKNVGLRPYRTVKPPYRFPQVTFDWTDISEDELKTYLTETARQ